MAQQDLSAFDSQLDALGQAVRADAEWFAKHGLTDLTLERADELLSALNEGVSIAPNAGAESEPSIRDTAEDLPVAEPKTRAPYVELFGASSAPPPPSEPTELSEPVVRIENAALPDMVELPELPNLPDLPEPLSAASETASEPAAVPPRDTAVDVPAHVAAPEPVAAEADSGMEMFVDDDDIVEIDDNEIVIEEGDD